MEDSRSIMTASPTPTENSAPSSWVDLAWCDIKEFKRDDWIQFAELLKPVIALSAELDLVSMLRDVKNLHAAMWGLVAADGALVGAIICRVCKYPSSYTVFLVQAAATDNTRISRKNMRAIIEHLEGVARISSCDAVRICGRSGWGRVYDDYVEVGRTFDKVIVEKN